MEQAGAPASKLDLFSKFAATGVLLVYSVGFLITSLYCVNFGFSPVNPFRARVASAGVWFATMLLVPTLVGRFVQRHHLKMRMDAKPWQRYSSFAFSLYLSSYSAAFLLSIAFQIQQSVRSSLTPFAVAAGVLTFVAGPIYKWAKKRTLSMIVVLLTLVGLLLTNFVRGLALGHGFSVDGLVLWVFLIAVSSVSDLSDFPFSFGWHTDWYVVGATMVMSLTIFASHVYPNIKASWGGGETLPVTLYLNANAPVMPNQVWHVQLIEESDSGYYVLNKGEKKAVFIPRAAVSLVYFSDYAAEPDHRSVERQSKIGSASLGQ